MFNSNSRYSPLPAKQLTTPDGRRVTYVSRRFVPPASTLQTLGEVAIKQGDRIDNIAYRTLGEPEQFWQICDANTAMRPGDLTAELNRRLKIPVPQV